MLFAILFPEQLQGEIAMALQLVANGAEIRFCAFSPDRSRARCAGDGFLEPPVVPVRRQRPFHAGRGGGF
jgi:hypothetical protein